MDLAPAPEQLSGRCVERAIGESDLHVAARSEDQDSENPKNTIKTCDRGRFILALLRLHDVRAH